MPHPRFSRLPVPTAADPDRFWAELTDAYLRVMAGLGEEPELAALLRGWLAAAGTPAGQRMLQELQTAVTPRLEQTVAAGQRIGAVRTDAPAGLILAVVAGMGQAMDTWLLQEQPDAAELPRLVGVLIEMLRGALAP